MTRKRPEHAALFGKLRVLLVELDELLDFPADAECVVQAIFRAVDTLDKGEDFSPVVKFKRAVRAAKLQRVSPDYVGRVLTELHNSVSASGPRWGTRDDEIALCMAWLVLVEAGMPSLKALAGICDSDGQRLSIQSIGRKLDEWGVRAKHRD